MNFLQKKIWIAWSKFRFLRLPVENRVRLEVTTDGRHITFLLVSFYEAGYGVQVVGSPAVFRELICLRKSAPIPFVVGGGDRECGISITDQSSTIVSGRSSLMFLDYDYFSGLNNAGVSHGGTENTEVGEDLGKNESRANFNHGLHEYTRIEAEQAGQRLAGQAGAEFSNPFTSELARASKNTSPTRSASGPAGAHIAPGDRISQIGDRVTGSDGGNQSADSMEFLEGQSRASLQTDNQKGHTIRTANALRASGEKSESVLIRDIRGQNASSLDTAHSPLATALRAPYFMHPSVYHQGRHKNRQKLGDGRLKMGEAAVRPIADSGELMADSAAKQRRRRRRFRVGFFGTHDRDFYTKHYHFPGMNRFKILEAFFEKFGDSFVNLEGAPQDWKAAQIAVSIDSQGGDRSGKSFLSQDHYFEALRECDFVLSPPGWCMPVSHNLVEAMFCGAIPITNGGAYMAEPLKDGETCLEFHDSEGFVSVIERALAMDEREVVRMRNSVRYYYDRVLEPKAFGETLVRSEGGRVLVNAEENSVRLVFPGMVFPWEVPAKAMQT